MTPDYWPARELTPAELRAAVARLQRQRAGLVIALLLALAAIALLL